MNEHELERMYRVYKFPEDPFGEGRPRYEQALREASRILDHEWVREVVGSSDRISLMDLCGGTGIGGVAFAKKLIGMGKSVELIIVDLRESALKIAREFSRRELGFEAKTVVHDARRVHELGYSPDIVLIWGLSTPHFSPWDLVSMYASVSMMLGRNGIMIVEESDRVYTIFLTMGYKNVLCEHASGNSVVVTMHVGHDVLTGYTTRVAYDLVTREHVLMNAYFWDIASSAAFAWIFFEDVDFMAREGSRATGYIIARKPRALFNPLAYIYNKPKILKGRRGH